MNLNEVAKRAREFRAKRGHWGTHAEVLCNEVDKLQTSLNTAHELLVPATRYYMGRMTIGTTAHAHALATNWHEIPENVRKVIRTDLEDAFRRDDVMRADPACSAIYYPLGADIDRAAWEQVRKAWSSSVDTPAAGHADDLRRTLELLLQATEHLLNNYGLDGPGHEAYRDSVTKGKEWVNQLKNLEELTK